MSSALNQLPKEEGATSETAIWREEFISYFLWTTARTLKEQKLAKVRFDKALEAVKPLKDELAREADQEREPPKGQS